MYICIYIIYMCLRVAAQAVRHRVVVGVFWNGRVYATRIDVKIYVCICIYIYIFIFIYIYMCVCVCGCVCIYIYALIYVQRDS